MAQYKQLQAPVTNPKASQQLADTQAIRARAAVGQAPSQPIAPAAQATGAALTAQAGQQALGQQAQQAGLAKGQAGLALGQQKLEGQAKLFGQEQAQQQAAMRMDQQLFDISEAAANEEQQLRTNFNKRVAQEDYLRDIELANWAVLNSQNDQDFKDKIQAMEQAHAKKEATVDHAYKLVLKDLQQQADKSTQDRRQAIDKEIKEIQAAWQAEQARRKNEAVNRQAMYSAGGTMIGAVAGGIIGSVVPGAGTAAGATAGAALGGSLGTLASTI